jgi:hypothetical protein
MEIRANVVSRVLGKVHAKSETHSTRIRGCNMWTRGYHVQTDHNDIVWVSFRKFYSIDDLGKMLAAMDDTLTSAGYDTEMFERSIKVVGKG